MSRAGESGVRGIVEGRATEDEPPVGGTNEDAVADGDVGAGSIQEGRLRLCGRRENAPRNKDEAADTGLNEWDYPMHREPQNIRRGHFVLIGAGTDRSGAGI